jgi:hypothetical protein
MNATIKENTLVLDTQECSYLVRLLEQALSALEVEIHRTDARNYRAKLNQDEAILQSLITKVRQLNA